MEKEMDAMNPLETRNAHDLIETDQKVRQDPTNNPGRNRRSMINKASIEEEQDKKESNERINQNVGNGSAGFGSRNIPLIQARVTMRNDVEEKVRNDAEDEREHGMRRYLLSNQCPNERMRSYKHNKRDEPKDTLIKKY